MATKLHHNSGCFELNHLKTALYWIMLSTFSVTGEYNLQLGFIILRIKDRCKNYLKSWVPETTSYRTAHCYVTSNQGEHSDHIPDLKGVLIWWSPGWFHEHFFLTEGEYHRWPERRQKVQDTYDYRIIIMFLDTAVTSKLLKVYFGSTKDVFRINKMENK